MRGQDGREHREGGPGGENEASGQHRRDTNRTLVSSDRSPETRDLSQPASLVAPAAASRPPFVPHQADRAPERRSAKLFLRHCTLQPVRLEIVELWFQSCTGARSEFAISISCFIAWRVQYKSNGSDRSTYNTLDSFCLPLMPAIAWQGAGQPSGIRRRYECGANLPELHSPRVHAGSLSPAADGR